MEHAWKILNMYITYVTNVNIVIVFLKTKKNSGMESLACKVYWFQNSAAVYQKEKVPKEYARGNVALMTCASKSLIWNRKCESNALAQI